MPSIQHQISQKVDTSIPVTKPDLSGKTALITGAARGLGRSYTRALVSCGCKVLIADVDTENGKQLQEELGDDKAKFVKCDVSEWQDQVTAFKDALKLSPEGRIDIVVNNAGVADSDDLLTFPLDGEEPSEPNLLTTKINTIGALLTVKCALFYFRKQSAKDEEAGNPKRDYNLVIQGSLYSYLPPLGSLQYAFSKWGQRSLMTGLRHTERRYGVRTNLIAPWYVDTGIYSEKWKQHLESHGVTRAAVEDAGEVLLRIVGDQTVNGRALAITPRSWKESPYGCVDVDVDNLPLYGENHFLQLCLQSGVVDTKVALDPGIAD